MPCVSTILAIPSPGRCWRWPRARPRAAGCSDTGIREVRRATPVRYRFGMPITDAAGSVTSRLLPRPFTVSSPESVTLRAAESSSASSLVKSWGYQCRHTFDRAPLAPSNRDRHSGVELDSPPHATATTTGKTVWSFTPVSESRRTVQPCSIACHVISPHGRDREHRSPPHETQCVPQKERRNPQARSHGTGRPHFRTQGAQA